MYTKYAHIKLYVFKLSISKNVFVRYFYICRFNWQPSRKSGKAKMEKEIDLLSSSFAIYANLI